MTEGEAFELLLKWYHGGGKGRAISVDIEDSYGAHPGWTVECWDSGKKVVRTELDFFEEFDDDWCGLVEVIKRTVALAEAGKWDEKALEEKK